jgi:hypothetical protein
MKILAYVVASFVAIAPMHAYAGQAQVPNAPTQLAWGGGNNEVCGNGILDILNCIDVGVSIL